MIRLQKRVSINRKSVLIYAAAIMVPATIVFLTFLFIFSQRKSLIAASEASLLYDATQSAKTYDANLRVGGLVLDILAAEYDPLSIKETRKNLLTGSALRITEAENIYILDREGRVFDTAYDRRDPELEIPAERLLRLKQGARIDCLILNAPAEGGKVLALVGTIISDSEQYYSAVLFSGKEMQGRLTALLSKIHGAILIEDTEGEYIVLGGREASFLINQKTYISAASSLALWPIRIRVVANKRDILRDWKQRSAILLSFMAAVILMIFYGAVLFRRGSEAEKLKKELELKELLFKEVNHRIKNNLMVVQSILGFALDKINEVSAEDALRSAENRITSIALLHGLLYKGNDFTEIDLNTYFLQLCEAIRTSFPEDFPIKLEIDLCPGLTIPFAPAVDCGMIINELITNAFKHAFPGGSSGKIILRAFRNPEGVLVLSVEDNGVGAEEEALKNSGGFGLKIIKMLSEKIGAILEVVSKKDTGTIWRLVFSGTPGLNEACSDSLEKDDKN